MISDKTEKNNLKPKKNSEELMNKYRAIFFKFLHIILSLTDVVTIALSRYCRSTLSIDIVDLVCSTNRLGRSTRYVYRHVESINQI